MIISWDYNCSLYIRNFTDIKSSCIESGTSQYKFLKNHSSDIGKEMGALKQILLLRGNNIFSVYDAMAGCGFSGKIFKKYLELQKLYLNDFSLDAFTILKDNFSGDFISCSDVTQISFPKGLDLLFVDFNNFTFRKKNQWLSIFEKSYEFKYLLFTDSACYGFNKFSKNLLSYGISKKEEYYALVNGWLRSYGFFIDVVIDFGNASLIFCTKHHKQSEFISYNLCRLTFKRSGGFLL